MNIIYDPEIVVEWMNNVSLLQHALLSCCHDIVQCVSKRYLNLNWIDIQSEKKEEDKKSRGKGIKAGEIKENKIKIDAL